MNHTDPWARQRAQSARATKFARRSYSLFDFHIMPDNARRRTVQLYRDGTRSLFNDELQAFLARIVNAEDAVRREIARTANP